MIDLSRKLKLGGSSLRSGRDDGTDTCHGAQPAPAVESVTVTGTSIRGVVPVGANVITVGPEQIQKQGGQTLDEILKQVPSLSNMSQVGQGQHNSTYFSPNIHQLGGSASALRW